MHQAGFLEHASHNLIARNPCSIKDMNSKKTLKESEFLAFKLADFSGAFVVLSAGFSLAVVALLCELIANKIFKEPSRVI